MKASDNEAVAALLQLGSTEPDPTPIDNVVPCDVPEDVLTSPPASPGQHRIEEFPANLQLHMQEKYLKKCLEYNALQDKVAALEKELEEHWARESVGREDIAPWGYSKIMGNSDQVTYYTGLPNEKTFKWVVSLYKTSCCSADTISHEDQVLLVLMRLRLDNRLCFLADLFKISRNHASTIFESS